MSSVLVRSEDHASSSQGCRRVAPGRGSRGRGCHSPPVKYWSPSRVCVYRAVGVGARRSRSTAPRIERPQDQRLRCSIQTCDSRLCRYTIHQWLSAAGLSVSRAYRMCACSLVDERWNALYSLTNSVDQNREKGADQQPLLAHHARQRAYITSTPVPAWIPTDPTAPSRVKAPPVSSAPAPRRPAVLASGGRHVADREHHGREALNVARRRQSSQESRPRTRCHLVRLPPAARPRSNQKLPRPRDSR